MFIWIFMHLRNPINVRQTELLTIWLNSEGGEDRFVVVQHLWCRKICQIVCRVSRKWMESKFLDQDVDVVSLANKGIVIGCFVGRNYNKILIILILKITVSVLFYEMITLQINEYLRYCIWYYTCIWWMPYHIVSSFHRKQCQKYIIENQYW